LMDRATYYTTFPIQLQAPRGKWNFKLKPVYMIGILDFEYDKDLTYWKERQLLRSFSLRDNKGVQMTDNLHFIFLQLPFFTKEVHQLETQFDKWCYFLKNLETMDSIPTILKEPIFEKAFDVASLSNMEKNDYILYQISKNKKYEMEIVTDEAREFGRELGRAEGKAEGKAEAILSIHSSGYTPSQISNLLKIPIENVIEVLQNHGFMITD
jgi:predicted transposase/invertase (TIGR01784 family)